MEKLSAGKCFRGDWTFLLSGKRDIFSSRGSGNTTLWERFYSLEILPFILGTRTTYALGSGPLILWDMDHLFSGIRTTYTLGTGPLMLWDPDHLYSGIRTTYPLGFDTSSEIQDMGYGPLYPLEKRYLGNGFQSHEGTQFGYSLTTLNLEMIFCAHIGNYTLHSFPM